MFLEDIFFSHLVGPSEQIGIHEKLTVGSRKAKLTARPVNILPILKVGGVIPSGN